MKDKPEASSTDLPEGRPFANGIYSRREFLKVAGAAGAALGMGAGLGALAAGCGADTATSTTTSATPTAAGPTTSAMAGAATTGGPTATTAGVEMGRPIKIGWVAARTGSYAAGSMPDSYLVDRWKEFAGDGIVCGDGKKHPMQLELQDSQSNSNRAAQVAGDLIQNAGVSLMLGGPGGGDVGIPVADQAEAFGTPSFTTDTIWQSWFNGRSGDPTVGFKWTYHSFWGVDDMIAMYFAMWSHVATNQIYGALWPNTTDGNTYREVWPDLLAKNGWKLCDPSAFNQGEEDYTSIVQLFKNEGVEVCAGLMTPPDFSNFWHQAHQQGFKPKICSVGVALNFTEAAVAMGDLAYGVTAPFYWTPSFPYKSSLTGETAQELRQDYEAKVGRQWTQNLKNYYVFEVAVDVFKRATDPFDPESVLEALKTTKLTTIQGPVDFTAPVKAGTVHPNINCCRVPLIGAQWVKGTGKWTHDINIVSNKGFEDIPMGAPMTPLI